MTSHIHREAKVQAGFVEASSLLEKDPCDLIGDKVSPENRSRRAVEATLTIDLRGGGGVHHDVVVEIGLPDRSDGALHLPLRWRATGHAGMYPAFDGELVARPSDDATSLELVGDYKPPLGPLGRLGDRAGVWRAAQRSVDALFARTAERLEAQAVAEREAHRRPAPAPEPQRDAKPVRPVGSENYLG